MSGGLALSFAPLLACLQDHAEKMIENAAKVFEGLTSRSKLSKPMSGIDVSMSEGGGRGGGVREERQAGCGQRLSAWDSLTRSLATSSAPLLSGGARAPLHLHVDPHEQE